MAQGRIREKTINNTVYKIMLPSVAVSMRICNRVSLLSGPIIAGLKSNVKNGGLENFAKVLRGVDPDNLQDIMMNSATEAKLSAGSLQLVSVVEFDQHFDDKRKDVYPVLFWVLWEVTKDFLPDMTTFIHKIKTHMAKMMKESESQSPTDGK